MARSPERRFISGNHTAWKNRLRLFTAATLLAENHSASIPYSFCVGYFNQLLSKRRSNATAASGNHCDLF